MKNLVLLLLVLVALASCQKRNATGGTGTHSLTQYKGVVRINMCGQIAIETIAPNYLGEDSWTSASGGPTYQHIFSVQNACQFGTHAEGDTITFNVVSNQVQNCAQCLAYTSIPATKLAVRVIN